MEQCDEYGHAPVAGMLVVNAEDLDIVAATRTVECKRCEKVYSRDTGEFE